MERTCSHGRYPEQGCEPCETPVKFWEVFKAGARWSAHLRTIPGDGAFPAGYVTMPRAVPGGIRGAKRAIMDARRRGMAAYLLGDDGERVAF